LKDNAFWTFLDQNPPFQLPPENGIPPSTKACPAQWPVIDTTATRACEPHSQIAEKCSIAAMETPLRHGAPCTYRELMVASLDAAPLMRAKSLAQSGARGER
jgi:hypothetical protein